MISADTPQVDTVAKRIGLHLAQYASRQMSLNEAANIIDGELEDLRDMERVAFKTIPRASEDGFCNVCGFSIMKEQADALGSPKCECMGLQTYALSSHPDEHGVLVKTHPSNNGDQFYKRTEADMLVRNLQVTLLRALRSIDRLMGITPMSTTDEATEAVLDLLAKKIHEMSLQELRDALGRLHKRMETEQAEFKAREETTSVATSGVYMRGVQEGIERTLHQLQQL